MDDGERHDQILRLEAHIETLVDVIESCRKVILVSRIAIAAGGLLILATTIGAIGFDPVILVGAITAVIGGIVFLGSNKSTSEQTAAALQTAEARRAELIGEIDLRVVGDKRA